MAAIKTNFGTGGANLTPGGSAGAPSLAQALRDVADDLAEMKAKYNALLVKMDADGGITDSNYEATVDTDALLTTKA